MAVFEIEFIYAIDLGGQRYDLVKRWVDATAVVIRTIKATAVDS